MKSLNGGRRILSRILLPLPIFLFWTASNVFIFIVLREEVTV